MRPVPAEETEALFRELRGRLFAFLRRRVESREDAEDLLQEVFARIHERAHRLEEIESVSGWVYRIARNAVIDHHRRRRTAAKVATELATESVPEIPAAPEEGLLDCLRPFVARLPDRYRTAIELTELSGRTQQEAAEELGLSVSGVKSRVHRGREKLKGLLLDCCHIELDRRRGVAGVHPRESGCACGAKACR